MKSNVKRYRQFLGYNQKEFAKLLNIRLSTYQAKEQGRSCFKDKEKSKVKEVIAKKISDVTIDEIFFG
ncbi:transcriptional regulator [Enterococcus faecalis]|uniref:helix-turn-helix transcriptional regulator n=1 Tax=Enterococcus faecalis TaxID=1351 RepID=UPI0001B2E774|nr:transcriptional regulator [Enterococcus faecalis]EEU79969.1 predicted protein [Enterococcus faecalis Fly1]EGO7617898.1 transcriptional regulator [Enterococcus faecalis]EGO7913052.1 transcriptional regulator [Enterococcus faecalis]EHZ2968492.1 transcriptional regulator [Enterococcus faecalis]EIB6795299.1 transcriptional regulator [Enterococcus faecalis]